MQTSEALNPDRIRPGLQTVCIGRRLLVLEQVSSTNDLVWDYAGSPDAEGLCVFAETQTAGRGRRGRSWYDDQRGSLLFSFLLQPGPLHADILTLAAAVAVAEALSRQISLPFRIKWPNDVLVEDRKVCGILTESRTVRGQTCFVIGIGLNVNQSREFFASLDLEMPATSLAIEAGRHFDRNTLAASILNSLDHWLCICRYAPEQVGQVWKRYNRQIGNPIRILENQQVFTGTCLDIDPVRGLLVHLHGGPVRFFHAANCTVIPFETAW